MGPLQSRHEPAVLILSLMHASIHGYDSPWRNFHGARVSAIRTVRVRSQDNYPRIPILAKVCAEHRMNAKGAIPLAMHQKQPPVFQKNDIRQVFRIVGYLVARITPGSPFIVREGSSQEGTLMRTEHGL